MRHRGPDWSGLHSEDDCYLAHQRLAIVDPASGDQPLYNEDKTIIVTVANSFFLPRHVTVLRYEFEHDCHYIFFSLRDHSYELGSPLYYSCNWG